ncbi:capsid protein [Bradyrhizobium sp. LTSP885]|uniref:capsid protein n=1 Tax=Bradyrhizobium sp. LTSP885 TaxID=1619232 RepID=UPI000B148024|nr:capsid protein [Bradyrhizobium sp. LTSP885]
MSYEIPGPNLSEVGHELLLEQYGGEVESQFKKSAIMRQYARIRPVRGTDTISNNRVGRTTLRALTPGVRPQAETTPFGKVALTVDTVVLARDNRSMLNELQVHFDARMELAQDHGKELGYFFDQAFIIMAIKGSKAAAPVLGDGTPSKQSIGAGKNKTLSAAGDELDPDKLAAAISSIVVSMEEEEIPVEELVIFVRPTHFDILLNSNKLINKFYTEGNGDYAKGEIHQIKGARIVKTARIPTAPITGHFLSNAQNGNAYDVSAAEAKAVAVVLHPKALLAGETIPLTSDIWFNREEKQWFIDSFLAFGVTVNRPDVCGAVFKA